MSTSLFISEGNKEKIAAVELEEDTTQWPRQVLVELYRALPDTTDYSPEVKFLRIDEEQGFGIGVVVLSSATTSALAATELSSARKALIPIIIKNHGLCPLDLLMTAKGKLLPLTEERLREALYRPETFDLMTQDWDDTQLWGMFFPPGRNDVSFGAGAGMNPGGMGAGMKVGYELLESLSGTVFEQDIDQLTHTMQEPSLVKAASANPTFLGALKKLSSLTLVGAKLAEDFEAAVATLYPAHVVQLSYDKLARLYSVKTANRDLANIETRLLDRGEFLKLAGAELTKRVDTEGTVTVSEPVRVVADRYGRSLEICDEARNGVVYNAATGAELTGWVFPSLVDSDGTKTPLAMFVNAETCTIQDQIAVGSGGSLCDPPKDAVKGTGSFYVGEHGGIATVPMTIRGAVLGKDGEVTYECTDMVGTPCKVTLHPGTQGLVALTEKRELLLPRNANFVRTDKASAPLVSKGVLSWNRKQELQGQKCAHLAYYGHDSYGIKGAPESLGKAASLHPDMVHDHTMFALCLGGLSAPAAAAALLEAEKKGSVDVELATVGTLDFTEQSKIASEKIKEIHALRRDLVKEAAALPDTMSVDSILSLGFINSENISTFVSRLPYLEKALSTLSELLLASRLGINEVPELPAARCLKSLNEVNQGLKALALREIRSVS